MKKHIFLTIIFTILISIVGCNNIRNNEQEDNHIKSLSDIGIVDPDATYSIATDGKKYFLIFKNEDEYASDDNACEEAPSISFASVDEMKEKVLGGKLSENEILTMSQFKKNEIGRIEIIDFSSIRTPSLPTNSDINGVNWTGDSYSVSFKSEICSYGIIHVLDKDAFDTAFKRNYEDVLHNNKLVNIHKTEKVTDRNATVYHYTTHAGELKEIRYSIKLKDGELFIRETYRISMKDNSVQVSDTIPSGIDILGDFDGYYFDVFISVLNERPSAEWLSSFGTTENDNMLKSEN
ncbi:MAG: hypothetical protein IJZ03_09180 [Clostridia bacterium]|nr:hypothetical protein [Clostridia bacterium]MBQ8743523.1 hypothetical protein [Clostridia bacterium]